MHKSLNCKKTRKKLGYDNSKCLLNTQNSHVWWITRVFQLTFKFSALPALTRWSGADFACRWGCEGGNFVVLPKATVTLLAPWGDSAEWLLAAAAACGTDSVTPAVPESVLVCLPGNEVFLVPVFVVGWACFESSSAGLCSLCAAISFLWRRTSALRLIIFYKG